MRTRLVFNIVCLGLVLAAAANVIAESKAPQVSGKFSCEIQFGLFDSIERGGPMTASPFERTCSIEVAFKNPARREFRKQRNSCVITPPATQCTSRLKWPKGLKTEIWKPSQGRFAVTPLRSIEIASGCLAEPLGPIINRRGANWEFTYSALVACPVPTAIPSAAPTDTPIIEPTPNFEEEDTPIKSPLPTISRTALATSTASASATPTTAAATPTPSFSPAPSATTTPSPQPTIVPTLTPTRLPTNSPTSSATASYTATTRPTVTNSATGTPSYTPTFTPSRTPTPTSSPGDTNISTPTATQTQTFTSTPSATATQTNTPLPTLSYTPTATPTPQPTNSPTHTPTSLPTHSPTSSATPSYTATALPTAANSATPTPTFTPTFTPSRTKTPTPTSSPSNTATPSPTATEPQTFTSTPSATPTTTPSPTSTYTLTVTPSPSATPTPSLSPTNSPTATNSATHTPSHTPTFTPSLTPTETPTSSPSSTPTPTATPSATPTDTSTPTPTNTNTPTPTGTNTPSPTATPTQTPQNRPPVALNLNLALSQPEPIENALSATDSDGDNLSIELGAPTHGTVTLKNAATFTFSYTANWGYQGSDSFDYWAVDSKGARSNTARVTLSISAATVGAPTPVTFENRFSRVQVREVMDVNRATSLMTGAWGPQLRSIMRDSAGNLWFVAEGMPDDPNNPDSPTTDMFHNRAIRFFKLSANGSVWARQDVMQAGIRKFFLERRWDIADVQQNAAFFMLNDIIYSYGQGRFRDAYKPYMEECTYNTRTLVGECHVISNTAGTPIEFPPTTSGLSPNYVGAVITPDGNTRVVWATMGSATVNHGSWGYLYKVGSGPWVVGPITQLPQFGLTAGASYQSFEYIRARFINNTRLLLTGTLFRDEKINPTDGPLWEPYFAIAELDLGSSLRIYDMSYIPSSTPNRANARAGASETSAALPVKVTRAHDAWINPDNGDIHILAATDKVIPAYFYRSATGSWSSRSGPSMILPGYTYNARFMIDELREPSSTTKKIQSLRVARSTNYWGGYYDPAYTGNDPANGYVYNHFTFEQFPLPLAAGPLPWSQLDAPDLDLQNAKRAPIATNLTYLDPFKLGLNSSVYTYANAIYIEDNLHQNEPTKAHDILFLSAPNNFGRRIWHMRADGFWRRTDSDFGGDGVKDSWLAYRNPSLGVQQTRPTNLYLNFGATDRWLSIPSPSQPPESAGTSLTFAMRGIEANVKSDLLWLTPSSDTRSATVTLWKNPGTGNFSEIRNWSMPPNTRAYIPSVDREIAYYHVDFDQDGITDQLEVQVQRTGVTTTCRNTLGSSGAKIVYYKGLTKYIYNDPVMQEPLLCYEPIVADFTEDGKPDVMWVRRAGDNGGGPSHVFWRTKVDGDELSFVKTDFWDGVSLPR